MVQIPAKTHRDAHRDGSRSSGGGARAAQPTKARVSVSALLMRAKQKNSVSPPTSSIQVPILHVVTIRRDSTVTVRSVSLRVRVTSPLFAYLR